MIFLVGLAAAIVTLLFVWWAIARWLIQWFHTTAGGRTAPLDRVEAFGAVAAQLTIAIPVVCALTIALAIGKVPAIQNWPTLVLGWPLFLPLGGADIWSRHSSFLSLPLFAATLASLVATQVWIYRAADRWRPLWPTVFIISFTVAILALCSMRFHHDILSAIERLEPDCIDTGSFLDAIEQRRFTLHTRALKGDSVYGWSFRQRDFYELPVTVFGNVGVRRGAGPVDALPSCGPTLRR